MENIVSDAGNVFFKLYENACLYFFEIIFVSLLSIITIFRREMSCNAVYTEDDAMIDSVAADEDRYSLLNSYSYTSTGMTLSRSNHELAKLYEYNNSATNGNSNGSDTTDTDSMHYHGSSNPVNLLDLPADIQIKCFSFLSPKDVLKFSCVNCFTYDMVCNETAHADIPRENSISNLLWYQLFLRDYSSVLTQWHAGMKAVERSRFGGDSIEHYDHKREQQSATSSENTKGDPSSSPVNLQRARWHCPDKIASLLGVEKECQPNGASCRNDVDGRHYHPGVSSTWKPSMKEFYLVFSHTWLEYSIAGQTQSPTLVGIHGHVFDMTSFLEEHPGSPESIIMQGGGRDATHFFESVGHSRSARSLALERLLEVVDFGCCSTSIHNNHRHGRRRRRSVGRQYDNCISTSGYGDSSLKRSNENGLRLMCDREERDALLEDITSQYKNVLPQKRSERRRSPGTLYHTRVKLTSEAQRAKLEARAKVTRQMSERGEMDILGNVNVYFDPLCYCWKAWYLNLDFESVFVHDVRNIR